MDPPPGKGSLEAVAAHPDERPTPAPLLARLHDVIAWAGSADLGQPDELGQLIGMYLDALMAHRAEVRQILGDPAASAGEPARLVREAVRALREQLAQATGSDLDGRIRAASAVAAVHDVVLDAADHDPEAVRAVISSAAVAILLS